MIYRIMSGSPFECGANDTFPEDTTADVRHVAYSIVAPVIVAVGILGNLLNLLVLLTRPFLKGGTRVFLTALTVSDLNVMLTVIPMVLRWNRSEFRTFEAAFYHAHVELFLNNTFIASSVLIVVCLTVERYFSVCLPTMFRSIHTVKIARKATLGCYALAVAVSAPLTVLKNVCYVGNESSWDYHENKPVTHTVYWSVYLIGSECVVRIGPCLVLGVLNVLIIRKFRKITAKRRVFREALVRTRNRDLQSCASKYKRALRNKKYQEEKRLVTLLRAIVVLFFLTMTPSAVLSLLYSERHEPAYGFQIFRAAANNLELANFALNFYVYFFCSREFRAALGQLFSKCFTCKDIKDEVESGELETGKFDGMLKVIKLNETSDLNSTGEKNSFEFSIER